MKGLKVIIMTTLYKMSIENKRNGELFVKNYNTCTEVIAEIVTYWKHTHGAEGFVHKTINVNDLRIESYISDLEDEDWIIRVYKTNERVKYRFDHLINDFYEIDKEVYGKYICSYTYFNGEYYTHFNEPEEHVYEDKNGDIVVRITHADYRTKYGKIAKIIVVDYLLRFRNDRSIRITADGEVIESGYLVNADGEYLEEFYELNSDLDKYKKVRIFNMKG